MSVNFVFDELPTTLEQLNNNLQGSQHKRNPITLPNWWEWGYDINSHLLKKYKKNNKNSVDIIKFYQLTLSKTNWDLFTPITVKSKTNYTISAQVKLGTATNFCITAFDGNNFKFLNGDSYDVNNNLSTDKWTLVTLKITSDSSRINFHLGAHPSSLIQQTPGTVFIKNLTIVEASKQAKSIGDSIPVHEFETRNGSFNTIIDAPTDNSSPVNYIELSQIDQHLDEFNLYPIVITTLEYHCAWQLLLLNKEIIDLVNDDKLKILLLCVFEPVKIFNPMKSRNDSLDNIPTHLQGICAYQKITKPENIIFATTDLNIEQKMSATATPKSPKFKDVNVYAHVSSLHLKNSEYNNVDWLDVYCKNYYNKPSTFLYLNGRITYQRYIYYRFLDYKNLLKNSIYSWNGNEPPHIRDKGLEPAAAEFEGFLNNQSLINSIDEEFCKFVKSKQHDHTIVQIDNDPVNFRKTQDPLADGLLINQDWISNTYFSIVTETGSGDSQPQVTEKIYKLMFFCHPFIVVGPRGHLAALRRYGFKTFPELFDESYDIMDDDFKKTKFICDQIEYYTTDAGKEKLKQILPSLKDTLAHNRNHLLSLSYDDVWASLPDLYNGVNT